LMSFIFLVACEASNDPIEDRFIVAVSQMSHVCSAHPESTQFSHPGLRRAFCAYLMGTAVPVLQIMFRAIFL
jgi:hypothetical protein